MDIFTKEEELDLYFCVKKEPIGDEGTLGKEIIGKIELNIEGTDDLINGIDIKEEPIDGYNSTVEAHLGDIAGLILDHHSLQVSHVTVSKIQSINFSQLNFHEKISIKNEGRPTPEIQISQPGISNNKKYIRSFNSEWYQRKSWLCGCEVKNALFCFPCLLYGGDLMWTISGFTNLNKMKEKTEKHECSMKHIDSVISLSLLGTVNINEKHNEAYKLSIIKHNYKVTKNREILSKIIDCIKLCGNFEISLRGRDKKDDSANLGIFRGLINFVSILDSDLKKHLESNTVFKGISKTIQNDILDCVLQISRNEIKKEIKEASFVAVMADDTTDVSEYNQMIIVMRYELNEDVFERFWGFFTPENQSVEGLSKCIIDQLDTLLEGDKQKLIAQTFDGANVMKGKKGGVQTKIKEVYNNAHFVHCYDHQLNLIMKNAASTTRNSKIFFSNLLAIPIFFSRSKLYLSVLNKHMANHFQCSSSTRRHFHICTVKQVYENLETLKQCLEEIQSTANTDHTISEATGILHNLNKDSFIFWLKLFYQILPHVSVIYNQMQSRAIDSCKAQEYIANFNKAILKIRSSDFSGYCENLSKTLMFDAKQVCDCICADIAERYSFTKQLVAAKLFDKKNFDRYNNIMPLEEIMVTTEAYPMIEKEKLFTELQVFYGRPDMHKYDSLTELLKFITENNLVDVCGETAKLIRVLLTIPMTTSEAERCYSTLKRIKTFLRSTMNQERLNALAMISIEKKLINSMQNFNERVINLFAQNKNRGMEFVYK